MSDNIDQTVNIYRAVVKVPSVVSATMLVETNSCLKLLSTWKQRDLERCENIMFQHLTAFQIDESDVKILGFFPGQELNKELLSCYSHCGNRRAVIREVNSKEGKPVQYLEIWCKGRKTVNVNLKEVDKHGPVISSDQFASFQWSNDDKKLLYIAERKEVKTCSFFNTKKKDDETPGDEHVWKDSWGEQLPDVCCPTLCIFEIASGEVTAYNKHLPDEISVGQAVWFGDNESVIFVAWNHTPYRLGLIFCPVRHSKLFLLNTRSLECKLINDEDVSVRSPRVHPDGERVFYLENPTGGPHLPCARLMEAVVSRSDKSVARRVVVDQVNLPKSVDSFSGIYAVLMPQRCFSRDGGFLFMSTIFRSHLSIISVHLQTGDVQMVTKSGSHDVLDVCDDIIVASHSTPTSPPEIIVAKVENGGVSNWHVVVQPSDNIEDMSWNVHHYVPDLPNPDYPSVTSEYILFKPKGSSYNKTLVIFPHGGPHSASTTSFKHDIVVLCKLGYTVVQINYRGSTGFGQDGIDSLPGRVGMQDVQDVHQVAKELKDTGDFKDVVITGWSHGGFLTLQLISQFPEFYLAACAGNPVVNMPLMYLTTDIPDWNYVESLRQNFEYGSVPVAELCDTMLEKSPIIHIKNAKAPVLMLLGECDLRVPPSQGIHWAKMYKALGRTCKVLMYKDNNHAVAKVDADADAFVNMVLWFKKYQNQK